MASVEGAIRGAGAPARTVPLVTRGRAAEGGFLAAVAAYAYLWPCRRVGARARTLGRPLMRNAGRIEIGADVVIDSRGARVELACENGARLVIGDGVCIGPGARIVASGFVEIGDRARIGAGCVICDREPGGAPHDAGIWIGDAVTLGEGVRVAPGTVIGTGAIVAPGSVVSGSIGPGEVVGGVGAPPDVPASAGP